MNFIEWLAFREAMALKGDYRGGIFQRLVAAAYKLAPRSDPEAVPAFEELARKITRQGEFLGSKFDLMPTRDDPYRSMRHMSREIDKQRQAGEKPQVKVFDLPPEGGHPVFSNDTNVLQRGVHDVIAHYFGQHPFSARGEYAAYNRHLKTLCNVKQVKAGECLAAKAMFTEVVAQTSYYYVYGDYAAQKAVILDDFDHWNVGALAPSSPLNNFFVLESKQLKTRPDFDYSVFAKQLPEFANELDKQTKGTPMVNLQPIVTVVPYQQIA